MIKYYRDEEYRAARVIIIIIIRIIITTRKYVVKRVYYKREDRQLQRRPARVWRGVSVHDPKNRRRGPHTYRGRLYTHTIDPMILDGCRGDAVMPNFGARRAMYNSRYYIYIFRPSLICRIFEGELWRGNVRGVLRVVMFEKRSTTRSISYKALYSCRILQSIL